MSAVRRTMRVLGSVAVAAVLVAGCSSADSDTGTAPGESAGQTTPAGPAGGVRQVDAAAFATTIAEPGTVLLDVRTAEEFAAGHLPKATNMDMRGADFANRLATLDKAAGYALYCRTGHRSGIAAEQMRAAGFTNVVDLAGGITAWAAEGRTVTTG